MFRTLRSQYLTGSISTFVLMLGLLAWNAVHQMTAALEAQAQVQAHTLQPILAAAIGPMLVERDHAALQQVVEASATSQALAFLSVRDSRGMVVAQAGDASEPSLAWHEAPVVLAGQRLGSVRFGLDKRPIEQARRRLLRNTWLIALLVGLAGLGLLALGTRVLSAGFARLARASRQVANGDYEVSLPDSRVHELYLVSDSFNRMAGAVRGQIAALRRSEQLLEQRVDERTLQLRQAVVEAERANRAKSRFLSRMSHELRTPLNAVIGFAQLLATGQRSLDAGQREQVDQITRAGWHLLEMINDVLDVSRIEAGEMQVTIEPLPLADVVAQALAMLAEAARARAIILTGLGAAGVPWVRADRRRLLQVLSNLVANAIKYNRVGGAVTISAARRDDGRVARRVSDTGCGFSDDERARLFEPFTRFERPGDVGPGTGIGLLISRHLTQLMGGELLLESSPGEGSQFTVLLAAGEPADAATAPDSGAVDGTPAAGRPLRRLLYIEDNPTNATFVDAALVAHGGYQLRLAPDGETGLAMAMADPPDLALVDIGLPGIDGNEVCRQLRSHPATRGVPLVAFSASAMPDDIVRSMAAGFDRYLTKPVPLDSLYRCLDELLAPTPSPTPTSGAAAPTTVATLPP